MGEAPRRAVSTAGEKTTEESLSAVYGELRNVARARLRASRRDTLLDTTALVHEFYIRVAESGNISDAEWPRFLQYASRVMRNIIVDGVRRRHAARHGGAAQRVELADELPGAALSGEQEVLYVHQALDQLETVDARLARVVEMRYFGGMTEPEIATALDVNERTVRRQWQKARLLLAQAFA